MFCQNKSILIISIILDQKICSYFSKELITYSSFIQFLLWIIHCFIIINVQHIHIDQMKYFQSFAIFMLKISTSKIILRNHYHVSISHCKFYHHYLYPEHNFQYSIYPTENSNNKHDIRLSLSSVNLVCFYFITMVTTIQGCWLVRLIRDSGCLTLTLLLITVLTSVLIFSSRYFCNSLITFCL